MWYGATGVAGFVAAGFCRLSASKNSSIYPLKDEKSFYLR
jgi:hypothetical protein